VSLYAFDLIELDGEDLRKEPLVGDAIGFEPCWRAQRYFVSEHFEGDGRSCSRTLASSASKGLSRSAG